MTVDYEKLLDEAKEQLPTDIKEQARFEIPKVRGHIEGSKTIISNFVQIADDLHRDPKVLLKYVLRELAAPGEIIQNRVVIGSKVSASRVNEKINQFAEEFVWCKECGAPDTKMSKESEVFILKCQACGARYSVYSKI